MQRKSIDRAHASSSSRSQSSPPEPSLEPGDEECFYTASLHFLSKRLQEKTQPTTHDTQSCCNLTNPLDQHLQPKPTNICHGTPALPMDQLLPFPKSSKVSFFTRLKSKFWKSRHNPDIYDKFPIPEDAESSKSISNFKFPRCERACEELQQPQFKNRIGRKFGAD